MKRAVWIAGPLILLFGAVVLFAPRELKKAIPSFGFYWGTCQAGDEIPQTKRAKISAAAKEFVALLAQSPIEARNSMSRSGKTVTRPEDLEAVAARYHSMSAISTPVFEEMYLLESSSGAQTSAGVPCRLKDGQTAFVMRGSTPDTAVVLLTDDLPGNSQRTSAVWMEHEEDQWRVRGMYFGVSAIAGRNSEQLLASGKAQQAKGHLFNAQMLYAAARDTLYRGAFFQPPLAQAFNVEIQAFEPPPILRGPPPFRWAFGSEVFTVTAVHHMGTKDGEVVLIIDHVPAWTTNEEAEAINRRLIEGFTAAYPEWREVFNSVVARAASPGGKGGWGTVFSLETGYSKPASTQKPDSAPSPR